MTNILIVGIGGVGGYFGGLLSRHFEGHPAVHIHFLSRGANLAAIQQHGVEVRYQENSFHTHPKKASDAASDFGMMDYIILCIKSYDLNGTLMDLKPCVGDHTVFVPLLNGVDSREKINKVFPKHMATDGCANVVTRLIGPGRIERYSVFQKMHFGLQGRTDPRLDQLYQIFKEAEIDVTLTPDIQKAIWSKYLFISAAAAATSYFDATFDEVTEQRERLSYFEKLVAEIVTLAKRKAIRLSPDIRERVLTMFRDAPAGATTSMHSDISNGKARTEIESLIGYVVRESQKYGLAVPHYKQVYSQLNG